MPQGTGAVSDRQQARIATFGAEDQGTIGRKIAPALELRFSGPLYRVC